MISEDQAEVAQIEASDDFEQEMNNELDTRFHEAEASSGIAQSSKSLVVAKSSNVQCGLTDWDSDDEEEFLDDWDKKKTNSAEEDKINDELFYDPNMDDEDQKWADNFRRQYVPKGFPGTKEKPLPNSDAVLNCPACFILLCLDCQRHSQYEHQYRAMFVMNCEVDHSQHLKYPKDKKKYRKGKGKKNKNEPMVDENDTFNPVKCNRCSTQVAVYDKDEIYHFFNVISSH